MVDLKENNLLDKIDNKIEGIEETRAMNLRNIINKNIKEVPNTLKFDLSHILEDSNTTEKTNELLGGNCPHY